MKVDRTSILVMLSAALLVSPAIAYAKVERAPVTEEESTNIRIYKNTNRAVVNISGVNAPQDFAMLIPQQGGGGSGIIISDDGYILTNFHVIEHASTFRVTIYDGTTLPAALR